MALRIRRLQLIPAQARSRAARKKTSKKGAAAGWKMALNKVSMDGNDSGASSETSVAKVSSLMLNRSRLLLSRLSRENSSANLAETSRQQSSCGSTSNKGDVPDVEARGELRRGGRDRKVGSRNARKGSVARADRHSCTRDDKAASTASDPAAIGKRDGVPSINADPSSPDLARQANAADLPKPIDPGTQSLKRKGFNRAFVELAVGMSFYPVHGCDVTAM
jgi:hypothetical protein